MLQNLLDVERTVQKQWIICLLLLITAQYTLYPLAEQQTKGQDKN